LISLNGETMNFVVVILHKTYQTFA